ERTAREVKDVALVRVEQFYPFPEAQLERVLARYRRGKSREWAWAQEESQNNGGWFFMEPRLRAMGLELHYVGRDASASPATGSHQIHLREQKELVEAALTGSVPHLVRATTLIHRARPAEPAPAPAAVRPAPQAAGS